MPEAARATDPSPAPAERPLAGMALRLLGALCLSAMFACVKLAADRGVHIIESVFYRQLAALLFILPWAAAGPGLKALRTNRPGTHISRMIVGMLAMTLNFWAVSLLPLAEATTIGFMIPILATLLAMALLGDRVGVHRWSAIVAGFAGVVIVLQPGDGHVPMTGGLIALTGAAMTAWVSVIIRQLGATEPATTTMFWFTLSSMVPLSLAMLVVGKQHDPLTLALLALMGLFGAVAQLCITASLRLAPVSIVLPMDYSCLIWASVFGWLIWGLWPGPMTLIGAPLIAGSGLYIAWREHRLGKQAVRQAQPT